MQDKLPYNRWLADGLFKQKQQVSEADIKRWISQKCIGYQVNGKQYTGVYKAQVEMRDGTIKDVWFLATSNDVHREIVLERPCVDIPQREGE